MKQMSQPRNCGLCMVGATTMMLLPAPGRYKAASQAGLTGFAEDGKL
jgi:hypothetical protein